MTKPKPARGKKTATADAARTLGLGFSPCPNDTFMFDALVTGKVEVEDVAFAPELLDIQELNRRALGLGETQALGQRVRPLVVTKLSIPALALLTGDYTVLSAGAALGRGNGPLVVRNVLRGDISAIDDLEGQTVAVPGEHTLTAAIALIAAVSQVHAGARPDEVNRLNEDLTPMGSERAGNAEGTIPEWTGGITTPPAGYSPGDHHPDPFASDQPLFRIDASNYEQYADKLSVGQKAMFERYGDTYFMDVYPTRRSASFPQRTNEMTFENGKTARLVADGEGVEDAAEGFPFPFPENAFELMWNHKLKAKGTGGVRYNNQVAPTNRGAYTFVKLREELLGLYYKEGHGDRP